MDLKAIEERANKATPGPWWYKNRADGYDYIYTPDTTPVLVANADLNYELTFPVVRPGGEEWQARYDQYQADIDLMTHAREDIPALLARVKELGDTLGGIWMVTHCECDDRTPVMCGHHVAERVLKDLGRWPIIFPTEFDTPSDAGRTSDQR